MNLTAANTAIVLDSTADFPQAPQRFANWRVVPLYVRFGSESFKDYIELAPQQFYTRLRTAEQLPTTSQPTPGDFLETYEELAAYERIYSLHISSALSGPPGLKKVRSPRSSRVGMPAPLRKTPSDFASPACQS